jgi:hypothetical protein|tara:strand:- start:2911 stop:3261 length:351 start_codon:yes stop_codon:yes gene_type:complete
MTIATDVNVRAFLKDISDYQLIQVIAKAEKWPDEKVYKTAHAEVHVEGDPWDKFSMSSKLPYPVREELVRAFQIHMDAGTLKLPKPSDEFGSSYARDIGKWFMIGWVIYFIILIFF